MSKLISIDGGLEALDPGPSVQPLPRPRRRRITGRPWTVSPPILLDRTDPERLGAVRRYDLGISLDAGFDRITAMAARRLGATMAALCIVDADRVSLRAAFGIGDDQLSPATGLCAASVLAKAPDEPTDTKRKSPSRRPPVVVGDLDPRFYAGAPLRTPDGHVLGALCVMGRTSGWVDEAEIDDLQTFAAMVMDRLELRLAEQQAVARGCLMSRETDHRVMNSLQSVASLLALQVRAAVPEAAVHLRVAAGRLAAVAHIHRQLCVENRSAVSSAAFFERLCASLSEILDRPIGVEAIDNVVATSWIQPVGLLVNELVTNAAKHGDGPIDVVFDVQDAFYSLVVSDRGEGLPPDFDASAPGDGIGLRVIGSLTERLRGTLTAGDNHHGGAFFKIVFPVQVA